MGAGEPASSKSTRKRTFTDIALGVMYFTVYNKVEITQDISDDDDVVAAEYAYANPDYRNQRTQFSFVKVVGEGEQVWYAILLCLFESTFSVASNSEPVHHKLAYVRWLDPDEASCIAGVSDMLAPLKLLDWYQLIDIDSLDGVSPIEYLKSGCKMFGADQLVLNSFILQ